MPFEMITMLGSTVLGGVMSIWSLSIKAKQSEQIMLLARAEVKEAREYDNVGFQWTRRIIALTAIFAIVVLPKVLPLISPDAHVVVGYTQFKPGFLFFEGKEIMKWVPMEAKGIIITPLDTNLVSAIIGLYFGGSLVKK